MITNAAKYTEPGGNIWIEGVCTDDRVSLTVRDDGIGMSADLLPDIFDLFVQADHAITQAQGGLGIGLTLVKNLIEMHGGTVSASSPGLGEGSEFEIQLPVATKARHSGDETEATGEMCVAQGKSLRILVVDDNEDAARSFATLLRLKGHDIQVAFDGLKALEAMKDFVPDAVFLDIGMPQLDGYEVARRMRQQVQSGGVVLVALTGWGQQDDRRRSADAGFDFHLVKPPKPSEVDGLLARIARH